MTVLPITIAPAASSARTGSDERSGTRPRKSAEPFSVGMPAVSKMSFTPTGTPWSSPRESSASRSRASRRARSGSSQANAWSTASVAA